MRKALHNNENAERGKREERAGMQGSSSVLNRGRRLAHGKETSHPTARATQEVGGREKSRKSNKKRKRRRLRLLVRKPIGLVEEWGDRKAGFRVRKRKIQKEGGREKSGVEE